MFNSSHWDTPNQQHKGPEGSGLQSQSAGSKQLLCEAGGEKHIEITLKLSFVSHDPLSSFFILRHVGPPYWRVICCWRQRMAVCFVEMFQKPPICFFLHCTVPYFVYILNIFIVIHHEWLFCFYRCWSVPHYSDEAGGLQSGKGCSWYFFMT